MDNPENEKKHCAFWRPFVRCGEKGFYFSIWSAFTLLGGLLGIAFNLVLRWVFGPYTFQEAIYMDSVSGSFYIFSIVLISSVLAPTFLQIVKDGVIEFRRLKIGFVVFSIFLLLFGSVFYSVFSSQFEIPIPDTQLRVDWWQLSFFIISIVIAIYSFGIKLIDDNPDENADIRETQVKQNVIENARKAEAITKEEDVDL